MNKGFYVFLVCTWLISFHKPRCQDTQEKTWSIHVFAGSHASDYFWNAPKESIQLISLPGYTWRPGFRGGISLQSRIKNSFYIKTDVNYLLTRTALETGGVVYYWNSNGVYTAVQCDYIEKQTQQFLVSGGLGYQLLPFLSIEASVFGITDLALEKSKICKATDYYDTFRQDKNSGFGINPALVFTWKNWKVNASYGAEIFSNRGTWFTDANGLDLGKFANKLQFVSLCLGYQII